MATNDRPTRRPEYVTVIAIYHFVVGALALLSTMMQVVVILGMLMYAHMVEPRMALLLMLLFGGVGGIFGVAALAVGGGLLAMHNWARWAAVVLALLTATMFPVGTVFGGLVIYFLLRDEGRRDFEGGD